MSVPATPTTNDQSPSEALASTDGPRRESTNTEASAVLAPERRRMGELDTLRGLGAVIVVWAHVRREEVFWAWTLMEMFFVLSAALLSSLVWGRIRTGNDLIRFYRRRTERIWPAYMITVAGVTVLCIAFKLISTNNFGDPWLVWRYATFSQYSEMIFSDEPSFHYWFFARHLWSLAIEEQFYITLPILCLLIYRLQRAWQLGVLGALFLISVSARLSGAHYYAISAHADGFILGATLALTLPWLRVHLSFTRKLIGVMIAVGGALLAYYLWVGYGRYFAGIDPYVYEPIAGVGAVIFWGGVIVWLILNSGASRLAWMRHPLMGYLGRLSYALYLVHYPIITAMPYAAGWIGRRVGYDDPQPWMYMPLAVILSFACAHWLYVMLDKPLQDKGWKKELQPR